MSAKSIVSGVLLLFVVASVVYMIASESRPQSGPDPSGEKASPVHAEHTGTPPGPTAAPDSAKDQKHKLIAYYFHRTQRCRTCLAIEAYAEEALKDAFPEALETGELEWRLVDVEEPGNGHFVEEYELVSSALVLVDTFGGEANEWRELKEVWNLVDDELKLKAYVEAEAFPFLEDGP